MQTHCVIRFFAMAEVPVAARSMLQLLHEDKTAATFSIGSYFGQTFYHRMIIPMAVTTLLLSWLARPSMTKAVPAGFSKFQATYLSIWSMCVAADWLQGPYVYALYAAYGFEKHVVALLFVIGFGSSLLFSCFAGSVADKVGRKRCCMAYCCLYIVSCLTKHFNSFWILVCGRITGGMATSLLFSCFECWMVSEHMNRHKFSDSLLSYMFGYKFQLMYFVAIFSGIAAEFGSDLFEFSPIAKNSMIYLGGNCVPFDMASVLLCLALPLIGIFWEENYGTANDNTRSMTENLREACSELIFNLDSSKICLVVACFEGAMYAFVFNWTPALEVGHQTPPFGIIFALFMMACSCGAALSTLTATVHSANNRLIATFVMGVFAFIAAARYASTSTGIHSCFLAFLFFEMCVGAYFPSVGILKSQIVPEQIRGTMYNLYRVPLNVVVLCLLLTDLSMIAVFKTCAILLGTGLVAAASLTRTASTVSTVKDK